MNTNDLIRFDAHRVWLGHDTNKYAEIDGDRNALIVEDANHFLLHQEKAFGFNDFDGDVDIVSPKKWLIKTGSVKNPHMVISVGTSEAARLQIIEGVTTSYDGSDLEVYNRKRDSSEVADLTAKYGPTVTISDFVASDAVVKLADVQIAGGTKYAVGAEYQQDSGFEFKTDTKYLVKVIVQTDNAFVSLKGDFYE